MTARSSIALALTVALPASTLAFEWNGEASLLYQRNEYWLQGDHATLPYLDLEGALNGRGSLAAPGVLDWSAGLQYQRLRSEIVNATSTTSALGYRARLGVLDERTSPYSLQLDAARVNTDFSTSSLGDLHTGIRHATTYGVSAAYLAPERPSLTLGLGRSEMTDRGLGVDAFRDAWTLAARSTHGTPTYTYSVDYQGILSDGTYAWDQGDSHHVSTNASAHVTRDGEASVIHNYYLRVPTRDAAGNPRYELNLLSGSYRLAPSPSTVSHTAGYQFGHSIVTDPGQPDRERTQQAATYVVEHTPSAAWRLQWTGQAAFATDRLGDVEARSAGESVGLRTYWYDRSGPRSLELHGGPALGALQPSDGGARLAYGALAGARADWYAGASQASAAYDAEYRRNLDAIEGWAFRQTITASGGWRMTSELNGRALLTVSAGRASSPLFGGTATRSVHLTLGSRWRRYDLSARAGVTSGITGVGAAATGDGLLFAPYDSHSRDASLTATATLSGGLSALLDARVLQSDFPDRPSQDERGLRGALQYRFGALALALEDTYTVTHAVQQTRRWNLVLVRVSRYFGSRM